MAEKSPFSQINQVGIVVENLDKAVKYYESLGIGPFKSVQPSTLLRELYGKPVPPGDVLIKIATAQVGEMQYELIQPIAEGTPWMEYLKEKGEGINHLGFQVDDIDKEEAGLVKKGFKVVYKSRGKNPDGSVRCAAYVDTDKVGGFISEIRSRLPK
ncbi:VOC family protein [Chloroflexota bacterium]